MESEKQKWHESIQDLGEAREQYKGKDSRLHFLAVSKAFENLVENSWRLLKRRVEHEGLEATSPRTTIKQAAKLHLITDPEIWLDCIDARNNSVHDYFGISQEEYLELARKLLDLVKKTKLD